MGDKGWGGGKSKKKKIVGLEGQRRRIPKNKERGRVVGANHKKKKKEAGRALHQRSTPEETATGKKDSRLGWWLFPLVRVVTGTNGGSRGVGGFGLACPGGIRKRPKKGAFGCTVSQTGRIEKTIWMRQKTRAERKRKKVSCRSRNKSATGR